MTTRHLGRWSWWLRQAQATLACAGLLMTVLVCNGCAHWQSADGTRHSLILGVGLVSTKQSPDRSATVLRSHTLGLVIQAGHHSGVVLGYQSLQQTEIGPEWQGIVEVSAVPGQPLTVEGRQSVSPPVLPAVTAMPGEEDQ